MQQTPVQPIDVFAKVLEATGGTMHRVSTARQVAARIASLVHGQGVREVLYEPLDLVDEMGLRLLLAAHNVELVPVSGVGDRVGDFPVALTGAEMAIAETGTLLLGGSPGGWGLASVLPWVHIVLMSADVIIADLPTAFAEFETRLQQGARDWVWITGPSRTADIGHTLVLGAHGPNSLEVMVVG